MESSDRPKQKKVNPEVSFSEDSSLPKVKKIIYFQPFPKMDSFEEYKKFVGHHKRVNVTYNGFTLVRDEKDKTYADYVEQFNKLLSYIEKQKEQFYDSFKRANQDITIEVYTLPKTEEELQKLREKFLAMGTADILLISAHGNESIVGLGEVSMNAQQIDHALQHIGLPNPSPFIVIWACNSATQKKGEPTIIDKLQDVMKNRGMISANATGLQGYLTTSLSDKPGKPIISVTKEVKTRYPRKGDPEKERVKISQDKYIRTAGTPSKLNHKRTSIGTQLRGESIARASRLRVRALEKIKDKLEEDKKVQKTPEKSSQAKKQFEQTPNSTPVRVSPRKIVRRKVVQRIKRSKQTPNSTPVQASAPTMQVQIPKKPVEVKEQSTNTPNSTAVQVDIVQSSVDTAKTKVSTRRSERLEAIKTKKDNRETTVRDSQKTPESQTPKKPVVRPFSIVQRRVIINTAKPTVVLTRKSKRLEEKRTESALKTPPGNIVTPTTPGSGVPKGSSGLGLFSNAHTESVTPSADTVAKGTQNQSTEQKTHHMSTRSSDKKQNP